MNKLIISKFVCPFEDYEKVVADFHLKEGYKFVKDYEIAKVSDHKAQLILDVIDNTGFLKAANTYFKDFDITYGAKYTLYDILPVG